MREEDLSNTECSSRWENEVDIKALLCWQVQKFLTYLRISACCTQSDRVLLSCAPAFPYFALV